MKKIKVFLGGYVTSINAQNLNCRSLAKYLDKERFEVYTLETFSGPLDRSGLEEVAIFRCFKPHRLSRYLGYLWGIYHADVIYLPKRDVTEWNRFLLKFYGKKSFTTVEGIYEEDRLKEITGNLGITKKAFLDFYTMFDRVYSITRYLKHYNCQKHGICTEEKILYLGSEIEFFKMSPKRHASFEHAILIGNDLVRKGIHDYLELAASFPEITFHVVGTGNGKIDLNRILSERKLPNVIYHGGRTQQEIRELLKKADLHILPSRSEGFPKVTLETAAAGVPSLLYDDYGADEWVTHGKNGFVVHSLDEMKEIVAELRKHPERLHTLSANATEMAARFDWSILVKEWEKVIEELARSGEKK